MIELRRQVSTRKKRALWALQTQLTRRRRRTAARTSPVTRSQTVARDGFQTALASHNNTLRAAYHLQVVAGKQEKKRAQGKERLVTFRENTAKSAISAEHSFKHESQKSSSRPTAFIIRAVT